MLLGPSNKPLARVLVLGEEASALALLTNLQRAYSQATNAAQLINSPWSCWWSWLEGESLRLYLLAPRSEEALLEVLGTQELDVLLWVVERLSDDLSRERGLLRALYLSKPSRVVVLLTEDLTRWEASIRELLQEANLPANEAEILFSTLDNAPRLMSALEREVPAPRETKGPFYMQIERVSGGQTGIKVSGHTTGGPASAGDTIALLWDNRLTKASINEIEVCGLPQTKTLPGYPTSLWLNTHRSIWEAALGVGLMFLTKEFTVEVHCFTKEQGGLRRSWSPGDVLEIQLRQKIYTTTLASGMLRPGERRAASLSFRSKLYLFSGERFFLLSGGVVLGAGIVQKIR